MQKKDNMYAVVVLFIALTITVLNLLISNSLFVKICSWASIFFAVLIVLSRKKRWSVYILSVFIFLCFAIVHLSVNVRQVLYIYDTTFMAVNTQSFWYNQTNPLHRDILIHTLLRNKTAVVPDDKCWYYRFVETFSGNIECDNQIDRIDILDEGLDYYNAGAMRMRSVRDLLDEEVYTILDRNVSEEKYQCLYIAVDGFTLAEKVMVLSDEDYNLFLIPCR